MVQPYLDEVDTVGETALVYFDGEFSHAIRKAAMLPAETVNDLDVSYSRSLYVDEKITARIAGARRARIGERCSTSSERFGHDLLYTRVDLLPGADGPVVIELELIEPSLFLEFARRRSRPSLPTPIVDRLAAHDACRCLRPSGCRHCGG